MAFPPFDFCLLRLWNFYLYLHFEEEAITESFNTIQEFLELDHAVLLRFKQDFLPHSC